VQQKKACARLCTCFLSIEACCWHNTYLATACGQLRLLVVGLLVVLVASCWQQVKLKTAKKRANTAMFFILVTTCIILLCTGGWKCLGLPTSYLLQPHSTGLRDVHEAGCSIDKLKFQVAHTTVPSIYLSLGEPSHVCIVLWRTIRRDHLQRHGGAAQPLCQKSTSSGRGNLAARTTNQAMQAFYGILPIGRLLLKTKFVPQKSPTF
jgi:hypothetical protein